jgi:UDP-N-acetylglucosamine 1-carboxyvinyltransferase
MGALLAKFHHVEIYFPGGCNFGARQIDFHLKGFENLGATITLEGEKYIIDAKELSGAEINLDFPSCGATINIMLAATKAKGTTIINNAAKEPEIVNVAEFLNKMGAKIEGAGTETIRITGVEYLGKASIDVIPDRIEAGTYLIAGALLGKDLKITNIIPEHIEALLTKLKLMNVEFTLNKNEIVINKCENLKPIDIKTEVFPGFPTDLAQPICVLLAHADGLSHIEETIYEKRMGHVEYLNKMGASIEIENNREKINGPIKFKGQEVQASDLRAGATLFLAALTAEGTTTITNIQYILRGYDKLVSKLSDVGAKISIKEIE